MSSSFPIDPEYLDLDRELAALAWEVEEIVPMEVPVADITERALFEYSIRSLGDFAFQGMGGSLADIAATLLGGKPLPNGEDYQI